MNWNPNQFAGRTLGECPDWQISQERLKRLVDETNEQEAYDLVRQVEQFMQTTRITGNQIDIFYELLRASCRAGDYSESIRSDLFSRLKTTLDKYK